MLSRKHAAHGPRDGSFRTVPPPGRTGFRCRLRRRRRGSARGAGCGRREARGGQLAVVERRVGLALAQRGGHARPEVGVGGIAEQMQVFHRGCADLARVVAGAGDDALGEVVQQVQGGQQRVTNSASSALAPAAKARTSRLKMERNSPPLATTLRPIRSSAWMPLVPS